MRPLYGDNVDDVQQIKELIAEIQQLRTEVTKLAELGNALLAAGFQHTCETPMGYHCDACDAQTVWQEVCAGTWSNRADNAAQRCRKNGKLKLSMLPDSGRECQHVWVQSICDQYCSQCNERRMNPADGKQDHSWVNQGICCRFHATTEQIMSTMIVCPECGDKRCDKASMCDADCQNTAESGTKGDRL